MSPVLVIERAGLFLLGAFFVWGGLNHFRIFEDLKAMLAARGWPMPGVIVGLASLWEAGWGGVLAIGRLTPHAAGALMLFVVLASVLLMDFWNQRGEAREQALSGFMTNVGLLGALVIASTLA